LRNKQAKKPAEVVMKGWRMIGRVDSGWVDEERGILLTSEQKHDLQLLTVEGVPLKSEKAVAPRRN